MGKQRKSTKSFPTLHLRKCVYKAGVLAMTRPFILALDKMLTETARELTLRACVYKRKRRTIRVKDIKCAYEGQTFGAREKCDIA